MSQPRRSHLTIPLEAGGVGRFQPTGFPDLGAALFRRPTADGWEECLHVESPQSVANHLEMTTWDEAEQRPVPEFAQIPYVQVVNEAGEFVTCSRTEPHRLASAYIMDGTVGDTGRSGYDWLPGHLGLEAGKPLDHRALARAVYALDPLSLVHGVFFAQSKGGWTRQPKIVRAVTAFIDATDVMPAVSGGVKTDYVDTAGGNTDKGYGMVPHHRVEYTARSIAAYVSIDHEQIRSYGLDAAGTELLEAIIAFELASLFGPEGVRLRTACELMPAGEATSTGASLLGLEEATQRLADAVKAAAGTLGEVTTVHRGDKASRKKAEKA